MPQPSQRLRAPGRVPCARTAPGELSGGNWNGREGPAVRPRCRRGRELHLPCHRQLTSAPPGVVSGGRVPVAPAARARPPGPEGSYLVDSASSHMLVSKIKPCMSKYKQSIR